MSILTRTKTFSTSRCSASAFVIAAFYASAVSAQIELSDLASGFQENAGKFSNVRILSTYLVEDVTEAKSVRQAESERIQQLIEQATLLLEQSETEQEKSKIRNEIAKLDRRLIDLKQRLASKARRELWYYETLGNPTALQMRFVRVDNPESVDNPDSMEQPEFADVAATAENLTEKFADCQVLTGILKNGSLETWHWSGASPGNRLGTVIIDREIPGNLLHLPHFAPFVSFGFSMPFPGIGEQSTDGVEIETKIIDEQKIEVWFRNQRGSPLPGVISAIRAEIDMSQGFLPTVIQQFMVHRRDNVDVRSTLTEEWNIEPAFVQDLGFYPQVVTRTTYRSLNTTSKRQLSTKDVAKIRPTAVRRMTYTVKRIAAHDGLDSSQLDLSNTRGVILHNRITGEMKIPEGGDREYETLITPPGDSKRSSFSLLFSPRTTIAVCLFFVALFLLVIRQRMGVVAVKNSS